MATKIRLARGGAKKRPYYRVVVADSAAPRDGRFIEKVGTFNPLLPKDNAERLNLKKDRIEHWLSKGAIPTEKVLTFINDAGIAQDNTQVKKLTARRNNVIELKKEEIAARKKAEEEAKKAEEAAKKAEEEAAKKAEEEAAAAAEAEKATAEAAAPEATAEESAPAEENKAEEGEKA